MEESRTYGLKKMSTTETVCDINKLNRINSMDVTVIRHIANSWICQVIRRVGVRNFDTTNKIMQQLAYWYKK